MVLSFRLAQQGRYAHTAAMTPGVGGRVAAIDIARGLIMALMALDHVRMYISEAQFDPVDVGLTDAAYFATRWVTHLCAPGFFFLAGLSVHLAERAGLSPARSSALLVSRGAWLVLLEFTLIGFAWSFVPGWGWFGVIWSLGTSMACLALLRWLAKSVLLVVAGAFLAFHNHLPMSEILPAGGAFSLLYAGGGAAGRWVIFPLLPWLAIMVLGYAAGPWLMPGGEVRAARFLRVGAASIAAFVVLRFIGLGEPAEGGMHSFPTLTDTVLSFLNVEKYPPSTQFVLATLGVLALFIGLVAASRQGLSAWLAPLKVFGRVPFAFYLIHLYVIHGLAWLTAVAAGWQASWLVWTKGPVFVPPDGFGTGLLGVYGAWLFVLALLYPPCAAFARAKSQSGRLWTKFL
jgi:uncharacterized membrane protein